jgi:hypothetical protein
MIIIIIIYIYKKVYSYVSMKCTQYNYCVENRTKITATVLLLQSSF